MSNKLKIEGYLSLEECREALRKQGNNIANDISSTLINKKRISSMRALLNLFEEYNTMIIAQEEKENPIDFRDLLRKAARSE